MSHRELIRFYLRHKIMNQHLISFAEDQICFEVDQYKQCILLFSIKIFFFFVILSLIEIIFIYLLTFTLEYNIPLKYVIDVNTSFYNKLFECMSLFFLDKTNFNSCFFPSFFFFNNSNKTRRKEFKMKKKQSYCVLRRIKKKNDKRHLKRKKSFFLK